MTVDNKTAEAATTASPGHISAGLFFSGWCREGFWSEGILHRGKRGAPVNLDKFLGRQEARRATPLRKIEAFLIFDGKDAISPPRRMELEIPVFMENHL